jgi:Zn-dependent protease with chaperone function
LRIKVALTASFVTAAVFWGLAAAVLKVHWLQREGTPSFIVAAAVASWLTWIVLLLHRRREKRTDDRLRQLEDEYRRREALLIKTIRQLAGAPTTGPQRRLYPVASGEHRRVLP